MLKEICITVICVCYFVKYVNGDDLLPTAIISQGTVTGKYMRSRDGKQLSAYTSIPFAEPPIGDLRFKPPVPAKPWNGNLDATIPHAVCPQINFFLQMTEVEGHEDCLYLNIYSPKVNSDDTKLYPVMIFIHGGGFFCGTGQMYGPDYLLDEDIVLVTFNYRLGSLGFLSTGDEVVSGNNGLKDQVLAIKWVYDNIKSFGGNPEKITLFGESAGGTSSHLHMFSPLSQGYIKASISQSGTAFHEWAVKEPRIVVNYTKLTAQYFGCPTDNNKQMIECLQLVDANELIKTEKSFAEWDIEPIMLFTPVIEINTKDAFLSEHPLSILKSGKYANIPWMTGVTSEEGLVRAARIFGDQQLIDDLDQDFNRIMGISLNNKSPQFHEVARKIREFYFGNKKIDNRTMYNVVDLYSDMMFFYATDTAVNLHFKYSKHPVYYYVFSHKSKHSLAELFGSPTLRYGTSHVDDLLLQFPLGAALGYPSLDNYDTYYSRLINKLWTNFAKAGDPTPKLDAVISTKWKPVETENREYLSIGSGLHTASNLYPERMKFWKELMSSLTVTNRDEL